MKLDKEEMLKAIEFARDHPDMPVYEERRFRELWISARDSEAVLLLNKQQKELIVEALNDLTEWVEADEYEVISELLEQLK